MRQNLVVVGIVLLAASLSFGQPALDNLQYLGFSGQNPAHLMDAEVVESKAYVSVGVNPGLETYDLSNPYSPARLSAAGAASWRSRHYGDTLFVFCRESGLRIFHIGASTTPWGSCPSGAANILFEGGAKIGNYLYMASHQNGLVAVNISNPASPFIANTLHLTNDACWNVESSGQYLFVANGRHGLRVVQTNGSTMTPVANLDLPGLANDIVLDGNIAVLTLGPSGIATLDVSNPSNPILLDTETTMGNAWGCGLYNHQVIVGSWRVMELFDVSNPSNIIWAGWENTQTWAMGAGIDPYQGQGLIAVADWTGILTYHIGYDPAPDIDVYPLRLDFGAISGGADSLVLVRNSGGGTLSVNSIQAPAGITVQPSSFTLAAGDSMPLLITASGQQVMGIIHFISNDPDEADFGQYIYANNISFPQVGSLAPDFTLQGTDGQTYTLSNLRGHVVFLEFGGGW